ncbi:MAG TPA: cation:proton antiporter [Gammaproteobacteria bacterium]
MSPAPILLSFALLFAPVVACAGGNGHSDPVAPVILGVTGILFLALLGRFGARKLGQPSVLGELVMGVVLGNLAYYLHLDLIMVLREGPAIFAIIEQAFSNGRPLPEATAMVLDGETAARILYVLQGPYGAQMLAVAQTVDVFSRYGVIFLLFLVGLDTSVQEMRAVGGASTRVAFVGVLLPFVLGFEAARLLMPELSLNADLFIAATLGATSVGITARVLKDLGQDRSQEARIILGAAVLDDVLGLVMLAIVSGIIVSGGIKFGAIAWIVLLALVFIGAAIWLGPYLLRYAIGLVGRLDLVEAKMFVSYLFVMVLAWVANLMGLATIIGAFTAGLILHDAYFHQWGEHTRHRYSIKDLIMPLEVILVPIFFVLMGIQVKLETFLDLHVIKMAAGLLVAAVIGKVAAGVVAGRGVNRLGVGIGMLPRGEVGLIFAAIGKTLGVISDALFSAVVLMVIVTTLIAPPLLKMVLGTRTE